MAMIQTFPTASGSGKGGHTILDTSGTAAAQEKNLQFKGLAVTDDSTNEITEVAGEGLNSDSIDDIAGANTINPAVIIGDANNYSTSEKIIGKWIDGKPLYQKTVYCNKLPNNTSKEVAHNILNMDFAVNVSGFCISSDGNTSISFPNANPISGTYLTTCYASRTSIILGTNWNGSDRNCYVTIQYTKTTD